jgi:hypothetical protein
MPKTNTATEEKPAKKRTILSPAERIAKLKAEAEALEAKEKERARGKLAQAEENVKVLTERRDQAQAKLDDAITVVNGLKVLAGETEESAPADA